MRRIFILWLLLLVAFVALLPTSAAAAEAQGQSATAPHNLAPTWREVRSGAAGITTTRGVETGVLIQSGGETWRRIRNGPVTLYGGILLCAVAVAIAVFYFVRGKIMLREAKTGRLLERFRWIERAAHWTTAGTFVVLALSGLALLFGKHILLPFFGYELYSWVAATCKNLHNFVGPLFLLSIFVTFLLFVKDNYWAPEDALWIRKAGGLISGEQVPSGRFNFGEKTWFWLGLVLLGLSMSVTGLIMDFPNFQQGRSLMQLANIVHGVGAIVFICLALGHIYIGTIGMEGALDSMRYGYVDEAWAKEHHELWYNEVKDKAAAPAQPAPGAAAAPQA